MFLGSPAPEDAVTVTFETSRRLGGLSSLGERKLLVLL